MTKIAIYIPIPVFLVRLGLWLSLRYKEIRFGHKFRYIKLPKGKYTIISLEDFDQLNRNRWSVKITGRNSYVFRMENGKAVYMHNQIAKPPPGKIVDHNDHNSLNNSRINLRLATLSQNNANRRNTLAGTSSKYKGVNFRKDCAMWIARVGYNGKRIYLGQFDNEIDAAKAYDTAAKLYHGEFAALNFK
jgi:hypothetical protein